MAHWIDWQQVVLTFFIAKLVYFVVIINGFPIDKASDVSRKNITHSELLPPDHVPGAHMEHDGHINKDFHHEAFLGTLVKEGKLTFDHMDGYRKLIDIFHKVDADKDHLITKIELQNWIHDRIMEHYDAAREDSDEVFKKVDLHNTNIITWAQYKATLIGEDPEKYKEFNVTLENDQDGEFSREVSHWKKADENDDGELTSKEFLAFLHPEHNKKSLLVMADEMMPNFDKDGDKKISLEEFTMLPPGEVDPEQADMDKEYVEERIIEFKEDMDSNSDGVVTMDELISYLDPRHYRHALKEADYLIRIADRNHDGKISEQEMLTNYALFTGSSLTNYARVLHDEF